MSKRFAARPRQVRFRRPYADARSALQLQHRPVFGGEYTVENIDALDLVVNSSLFARIHEQIRDLPDGTQIEFVVGANDSFTPKPFRGSA